MIPLRRLSALATAAVLGACAVEGPFPSLAPRPGERPVSMEEPVRAPVAVAPDPALAARAAELVRLARAGDRDFAQAYPGAAQAARAAGGEGSDGWIVAQQALSRLEAARGETMRALASLDLLAVDRADEPTNAADFAAVLAAQDAVEEMVGAQEARLDALRRLVSPG